MKKYQRGEIEIGPGIVIAVMLLAVTISGAYMEKQKSQEKIACYEAAKTNNQIKCDK